MKPSSSKKCPEFFKFYAPHLSSQCLKIPSAFVEYLGDNIPQTAILKDASGKCQKTWEVEVEEQEDGVYMEDGWQGFVQDNPLKKGDFLVFSYDNNSTFSVKLFGTSACRKELGPVKKQTGIIIVKEEEDQTEPESVSAPLNKPRPSVAQEMSHETLTEVNPRGPADMRIGEVRESGSFDQPKGPCFRKLLGKSSPLVMYLDLGLIKDYKIKFESSIKVVNSSGTQWEVNVLEAGDGRTFLGYGWPKFFTENGLKVRDKCVFEFVLEEEGTICREVRVQVLRRAAPVRIKARRMRM